MWVSFIRGLHEIRRIRIIAASLSAPLEPIFPKTMTIRNDSALNATVLLPVGVVVVDVVVVVGISMPARDERLQ